MSRSTRRRAVVGLSAAAALAALPHGSAAQTPVPSLETNKAVVRRLFNEVYSDGNFDVLDQLLAPDFIGEDSSAASDIAEYKRTQATVRARYERLFHSFAREMTDVAAEDPLVFVRITFTGQPIADGKADVATQGFLEASLANGKIARLWSLIDVASLIAQLEE